MEQQEVALLGKITAGMSHEMRNVLATIRESSGLMQDVLALASKTPIPYQEKFSKALATIDKHVSRGVQLATQLNKFSHSMDDIEATVELNELLGHVTFLMQRFARLREVELSAAPLARALPLRTNPIRLILALSACVEHCLELTVPSDRVELQPETDNDTVGIRVIVHSSSAGVGAAGARIPDLGAALSALGGRLESAGTPDAVGLKLVLPLHEE